MGVTITTRVSKEIEEKIALIAREEKLDKSTVIRRLLSDAIKKRQIERALDEYREERVTLARAARMAGVSLRKMMQLAAEAGVPFQYSVEDLRKDFEAAVE
jgi:predicted HTH domain antitoxin